MLVYTHLDATPQIVVNLYGWIILRNLVSELSRESYLTASWFELHQTGGKFIQLLFLWQFMWAVPDDKV